MVWRCRPLTTKPTTDRTLVLIQGGMSIGGVSVQAGITSAPSQGRPLVISVQAGDVVIVWATPDAKATQSRDWWLGEVLSVDETSAEDDRSCLLQVADVDSGMICLVECDQVQRVRIPVHAPLTTT